MAVVAHEWQEICQHGERFFGCPTCWPVEPGFAPAFAGLAGDIVRSIAPRSEVHPGGLLLSVLAMLGNEIGPKPHVRVGAVSHRAQLFTVNVGETSVARKGQAYSEAEAVMVAFDPAWVAERVFSGFGSGEGVIARVAERMNKSFSSEVGVVHDPRLLIREGEFTSILRVAGRDGSTLSAVIRDAWDGRPLQNNVNKARLVAPAGSMITIIADVTQPELRRELHSSEIANGFANRYLFGVSRRPQKIARPKRIDVSAHASRIRQVVDQAQRLDSPVGFTDNGAAAWELVYERLEDEAEQADGLIGPLVARGSAHTLRLALIYSLLDGRLRSARTTSNPPWPCGVTARPASGTSSWGRPATRSPTRSWRGSMPSRTD